MDFGGSTDDEVKVVTAEPAAASNKLASVKEEEPAGGLTPGRTKNKIVLKENSDFEPPPPPPGPPPGQQFKLPPPVPETVETGAVKVDTVNLKPARGELFHQVTAGDLTLKENPQVIQSRRLITLALRSAVHCRKFYNLSREVEQMVVGLKPRQMAVPLPGQMAVPLPELPFNISFCIACFNREWQLLPALQVNLATCEALLGHSVRFVVMLVKDLAMDDEDEKQYEFVDCVDRIRQDHKENLRNGSLVVGLGEAFQFHCSRFKNASHRLAVLTPWNQGMETSEEGGIVPARPMVGLEGGCAPSVKPEVAASSSSSASNKVSESEGGCTPSKQKRHILINLDADNILAQGFAEQFAALSNVVDHINLPWDVMWGFRWMSGGDSGCTGRVGMPEETFCQVGGYDESFHPTGYQDIDIFERIAAASGRQRALKMYTPCGWSIPNTTSKAKGAHHKAKALYTRAGMPWAKQNEQNRAASKAKLERGQWWRNTPEGQRPPALTFDTDSGGCTPESRQTMIQFVAKLGQIRELDDQTLYPKRVGARPIVKRKAAKQEVEADSTAVKMKQEVDGCTSTGVMAAAKVRAQPLLPERVTMFRAEVISLGIENLFDILPNLVAPNVFEKHKKDLRVFKIRASRHAQIDEDLLKNVLQDGGIINSSFRCFFVDMRFAFDPDTSDLRGHVGLHPRLLSSVATCDGFPQRILEIRKNVLEMLDVGPAGFDPVGFSVVFYCKKGTHRSTSGAEFFHNAINMPGKFAFASVEGHCRLDHLMQSAGEWRHPRRCGPCELCCGDSEEELGEDFFIMKKNAYNRVRSMWTHGK